MAVFTIAFGSGDELNIEVAGLDGAAALAAKLDREGYFVGMKIGFVPSGGPKPTPKPYGEIAVMRAHVKSIRLHD